MGLILSPISSNSMFKNILIFGHSNLGDACYDLAPIRHLRLAYPASRITFLTSTKGKELAQGYPGIDEILTFDKYGKDKGIFKRLALIKHLRLKKFDLAIILPQTLFFIFLGIPNVWVMKKRMRFDTSGRAIHVVDGYLNLIRSHSVPAEEGESFNFTFSKAESDFAESFFANNAITPSDRVVAILPFTNWSYKCWPIEKWNELIRTFNNDYALKVVLLGKAGIDKYSQGLLTKFSPLAASAVNKCTLKQSMAIIKRAKLFMSCDSSLIHIASCMHIPSIGLFGPTEFENYYPYFHRQGVIVAQSSPDCAPCSNTKHFAKCRAREEAPCMHEISIKEVLEKAREELSLG